MSLREKYLKGRIAIVFNPQNRVNWDSITDFLPLLLLSGLWFIGKLLSREEEEQTPPPSSKGPKASTDSRKGLSIEEEIRRKIIERQENASLSPDLETLRGAREGEKSHSLPAGPTLQERLAEQRSQLRETEARIAKVVQKAKGNSTPSSSLTLSSKQVKRGKVIALHQPSGLRRAIIYNELLSAPISLRKIDGSFAPLWRNNSPLKP